MDDDNSQPSGRVVAAVLGTLAPTNPELLPWTAQQESIVRTANEWQQRGAQADIGEMHGMINGAREGAVAELIGRLASAGEQLGLSLTAASDARRWLAEPEGTKRSIAVRGLAEMSVTWMVSTAHGVANVAVRTLSLNPVAASVLDKKFPASGGFAPYEPIPAAWIPFNADELRKLAQAASATGFDSAISSIEMLREVARDPRWQLIRSYRDNDFHRWRQHTFGPPTDRSPWTDEGDARVMSVFLQPVASPLDYSGLLTEVENALILLATTMDRWLSAFPRFIRDVGVGVWVIEDDDASDD